MPTRRLEILLISFFLFSPAIASDYSVNPWIGTGGPVTASGMTFPGATAPFGMVRLSPDTSGSLGLLNRPNIGTGGYYHSHDRVLGFSHTRLSGTGVSDGGLLRVTPVTNPRDFERRRPRLVLNHRNEWADAGHYGIRFTREAVEAELTTTVHCGAHRYQRLNPKKPLRLLINGTSGLFGNVADNKSTIAINRNARTFEGATRLFGQFSKRYGGLKAYYYGEYSSPAIPRLWQGKGWLSGNETATQGDDIGLGLAFDKATESVELKVCVSYVSSENARANFESEVTGKTFASIKKEASSNWRAAFSRLKIKTDDEDVRTIFWVFSNLSG